MISIKHYNGQEKEFRTTKEAIAFLEKNMRERTSPKDMTDEKRKEHAAEAARNWRAKNREHSREYMREYMRAYKAKKRAEAEAAAEVPARKRRPYKPVSEMTPEEHERVKAQRQRWMKKYRDSHKEEFNEYHRQYQRTRKNTGAEEPKHERGYYWKTFLAAIAPEIVKRTALTQSAAKERFVHDFQACKIRTVNSRFGAYRVLICKKNPSVLRNIKYAALFLEDDILEAAAKMYNPGCKCYHNPEAAAKELIAKL